MGTRTRQLGPWHMGDNTTGAVGDDEVIKWTSKGIQERRYWHKPGGDGQCSRREPSRGGRNAHIRLYVDDKRKKSWHASSSAMGRQAEGFCLPSCTAAGGPVEADCRWWRM